MVVDTFKGNGVRLNGFLCSLLSEPKPIQVVEHLPYALVAWRLMLMPQLFPSGGGKSHVDGFPSLVSEAYATNIPTNRSDATRLLGFSGLLCSNMQVLPLEQDCK